MNAFSLITVTILGILLTVFSALLLLTIIYNVKVGARYREPLAQKLQTLRLNKMLSALGIDTYEYLHKESVVTIHEQMNRCSECANTDECDDNLSSESITADEIDFCNNEASLQDMLSKKRIAD